MKFARWTFRIAGTVGLLILLPMYFLEQRIGTDTPPAITHPEFYYGFIGTAVAFQIVFLLVATDPRKYRLLMPAAMVEKAGYALPTLYLIYAGRAPSAQMPYAILDLVWFTLFAISFKKTA